MNSHNTIVGCYIGTDVTGTIAMPNGCYDSGICSGIYVNGNICHHRRNNGRGSEHYFRATHTREFGSTATTIPSLAII